METYSRFCDIIEYMRKEPPDLMLFFLGGGGIVDLELAQSEKMTKSKFLRDQIELSTYEKFDSRYPSHTVMEAINISKKYDSASIYSVQHPIANEEYDELFLLYNPVHLLKNI